LNEVKKLLLIKIIKKKNETQIESLNLENTIWSNTVIASGNVIALVIYTGIFI
jgi:magnesium-transporting ATPase (P-type)